MPGDVYRRSFPEIKQQNGDAQMFMARKPENGPFANGWVEKSSPGCEAGTIYLTLEIRS